MRNFNNYAEAVFSIGEDENCLELIRNELNLANTVFLENPDYSKLLDNPALSKEERVGLIDEAFSEFSENTKNLIKILTEKKAVSGFEKLCLKFTELYNKKMGIIPVEVISAVKLSDEQTERLRLKLSKKLSANVEITNSIDKSILGGLILRYSSVQLDGSVKSRLDAIAKSLRSAVI